MKVKIGEVDVFYKSEGSGFPLLMIHGYSLDHRLMTGCMEPILQQLSGFQRVYFDLPGMGQTAAHDSIQNSQDMLDLVCGFIEKLIPTGSFAVVGQSYGGYLARGVAHQMPERCAGLLLICPVVNFIRSKRTVPKLKVLEKDESLIADLSMLDADEFQSCVVLQNKRVWDRFNNEIMSGIRLADFSLLERVRDTEFSFNADQNAAKFNKPITVLLGRHDNSVGYLDGMKLFRKYPSASLILSDRAGHNFHIEQEELFNAAAIDWIKRLGLGA